MPVRFIVISVSSTVVDRMPDSPGQSKRPILSAHFQVTVGDHKVSLTSVTTLHDVLKDVHDIEERRTVVFRRALSQDRFLYRWYRDTRLGKDTTAAVIVELLQSAGGEAVNRWVLEKARPIRWSGPQLDALANELAMEELQVQYESITWLDT